MDFELNEDALRDLYADIGLRVQQIVNDTAEEAADQDLDTAVDTLHARINEVDGLAFERDWSQNAIETLRRGDDLEISLG